MGVRLYGISDKCPITVNVRRSCANRNSINFKIHTKMNKRQKQLSTEAQFALHIVKPRFFFLKSKWTKWVVLHVYHYDYYTHIVSARKQLRTGDIQFKTTKVNGTMNVGYIIECNEINFNDTFPKFLNGA